MHSGLQKNIHALFAGNDAVMVSDSEALVQWLSENGMEAITFEHLIESEKKPPHVVAVPLEYENCPSRAITQQIFSNSSVLWVPIASFPADLDTAKYTMEVFAQSDITETVKKNRRVITRFLLAQQEVLMAGPGTELTLQLPSDTLKLLGRTRLELLADEHAALGNYCEVNMSPKDLSGVIDPEISISGALRIDSVLAAKHREFRGPAEADRAPAMAEAMRKACPLQLTIQDNKIVAGLDEWEDSLQSMCGPGDSLILSEIAVGTGVVPKDKVDWSRNAVVNEGAAGVHFGIGDAINGAHFDFISVETRFDGL